MRDRESDIERVRARRAELVNMMERTRARVEAAEDALERADDFREEMVASTWTEEIHPSLGTVTMDGRGYLRDLRLDTGTLRQSDPSRLGERILAAIHAAERRAVDQRRQGLEEIFRHVNS